jgi:4-hydroxy-tetrahydrodipicolinate reductase
MRNVSVVIVGLGSVGVDVGRALSGRKDCVVVGAHDIQTSLHGRDLEEVLDVAGPQGIVATSIEALPKADVAFVATTSFVEPIEPLMIALLSQGYNVVSICEELGYPAHAHPEFSARVDKVARANNRSVLGTGCNPGMLMDTLPLLLSSLTQRVKSVQIERITQMVHYGHILGKFGIGLTEKEFTKAKASGRVIGHVGFTESIAALASGLGWVLDAIEVDEPTPAFLASNERTGDNIAVAPETIAAVRHAARGIREGKAVIEVAIHFGFFEDGDPVIPGDRWSIKGEEQTLEFVAPLGLDSLKSTVAVASNAITAIVDAKPGLCTMASLPAAALASKGAHRLQSTTVA